MQGRTYKFDDKTSLVHSSRFSFANRMPPKKSTPKKAKKAAPTKAPPAKSKKKGKKRGKEKRRTWKKYLKEELRTNNLQMSREDNTIHGVGINSAAIKILDDFMDDMLE